MPRRHRQEDDDNKSNRPAAATGDDDGDDGLSAQAHQPFVMDPVALRMMAENDELSLKNAMAAAPTSVVSAVAAAANRKADRAAIEQKSKSLASKFKETLANKVLHGGSTLLGARKPSSATSTPVVGAPLLRSDTTTTTNNNNGGGGGMSRSASSMAMFPSSAEQQQQQQQQQESSRHAPFGGHGSQADLEEIEIVEDPAQLEQMLEEQAQRQNEHLSHSATSQMSFAGGRMLRTLSLRNNTNNNSNAMMMEASNGGGGAGSLMGVPSLSMNVTATSGNASASFSFESENANLGFASETAATTTTAAASSTAGKPAAGEDADAERIKRALAMKRLKNHAEAEQARMAAAGRKPSDLTGASSRGGVTIGSATMAPFKSSMFVAGNSNGGASNNGSILLSDSSSAGAARRNNTNHSNAGSAGPAASSGKSGASIMESARQHASEISRLCKANSFGQSQVVTAGVFQTSANEKKK